MNKLRFKRTEPHLEAKSFAKKLRVKKPVVVEEELEPVDSDDADAILDEVCDEIDQNLLTPEGIAEPLPELRAGKSRFLHFTVRETQKKDGCLSAALGGEVGETLLGVPCPFPFQYIIQNTVYPLGMMTQVVGTEGTMKSGLVAEMGRWFARLGGYLSLIENESKISADWFDSIMGYPDEIGEQVFKMRRAESTDHWQTILQEEVGLAKELMLKGVPKQGIKPLGATFPVLVAVDSIMGKLSSESQDRIAKVGFADRAHPVEALQITAFLKKLPQDILKWPISFVAVNHLKPKKAEFGFHIERGKSGGRGVSFQESWELQLSCDKSSDFTLVDPDPRILEIRGKRLILDCYKNSHGDTKRPPVHVSIVWKNKVLEDGSVRQYTKWDWPAATIDLLLSFKEGRGKKIQNIVDIIPQTGSRFSSSTLGIPKSDAISKTEIGRILESKTDIIEALQTMFCIKRRTAFKPGEDFFEQTALLTQQAEERNNRL